MNIDELLGLMKKRRSIRRFKPDPIPDEYVTKVLEAARWAPSGANAQPWEFIVVKDQKTKDAMAELYRQIRPEHYFIEQTRQEDLRHNNLLTMPTELPNFKDAPVLIVVCGDRRTFQASVLAGTFIGSGGSMDSTYQKSLANAIFSMHLAAAALGLGAQWASVIDDWGNMLRPLLGIPPVLHIHVIVPLGYPAYEPKSAYRRELEEIVHYEKYDMSKYRTGDQIIAFIRELRGRTKPAYEVNRTPKGGKKSVGE